MSDADAPLEFIGSAEDDLFVFPPTVKRVIGFAIRIAQKGGKHPDAKPLKGFKGAGVLEVISEATMKKKIKSTKSSGNVFADLGLPNAEEHLVKADIVIAIASLIKSKGLTQVQASKLIGLAQPDVSKLLRGHFAGYSFERLFGFLRALGNDVEIKVIATKKEGHLYLEMA